MFAPLYGCRAFILFLVAVRILLAFVWAAVLAAPQAICAYRTLARKSYFLYNHNMSFATEEIAEVKHIVQQALEEYSPNASVSSAPAVVFRHNELELFDRMVRVEEELKHLREDMQHSREDSNRRFEEMLKYTDKRFEQVDKRFEAMQANMNLRFSEMQANTDKRFAEAQANTDKHFGHVNKRFTTMQWSINLSVAFIVALISILKFIQ